MSSAKKKDSLRKKMVEDQIVQRGVENTFVLEAMKTVPREAFMPENVSELAYEDRPVPIGEGQTISQPYIVALMAELAELESTDKVLEIGTGSGYGAAILSRICRKVFTMERHRALAESAASRLKMLGYDNVQVFEGDGTEGLPNEAPFDAIVITAAAPGVPETLQEQLKIGGRLIIPAGTERYQHMLKISRTGEKTFETTDHGMVAFVPMIGKYGWQDKDNLHQALLPPAPSPVSLEPSASGDKIFQLLRQETIDLPDPESSQFGQKFEHLATADIVLLGEATHGTAEFYLARAAITQYLVQNHGFSIIALEADWPDVAVLDGYVRDRAVPDIGQAVFERFPEWMWSNEEFLGLIHWLKKFNDQQENFDSKASVYGLDLYSMQTSIHAVINFLAEKNPELADLARKRYSCFEPWLQDLFSYGRSVLTSQFEGCEKQAVEMLVTLMKEREMNAHEHSYLDVIRNAKTITQAEQYYRSVYQGSAQSWNLRDRHMFDTLQAVINTKGKSAKAIVWAHNSHIGDARATELGHTRNELNLGQLCKEYYGKKARLVGFGTAKGEVAAASHWGEKMEVKTLRAPLPESFEKLWQDSNINRGLLKMESLSADLQKEMNNTFLQRAVGVIYRPESERQSHYFKSTPAQQFDDYIWFANTHAISPAPIPFLQH